MPGFGTGVFGEESFGEFAWAKAVLYDSLPAIYRTEDQKNGFLHLKFAQGQQPLYDRIRRKIRSFHTLRDPYSIRTQYNEQVLVRLGRNIPLKGDVVQSGLDGKVVVTKEFAADTARFTAVDIGRELSITGATVSSNNATVTITAIISPQAVATFPTLLPDAGPFRWELRALSEEQDFTRFEIQNGDVGNLFPGCELLDGNGQFILQARRQLRTTERLVRLLTEKEGVDGSINSDGFFVSTAIMLSQQDVGKKLTISKSSIPENNVVVDIAAVRGNTIAVPSWAIVRGETSDGGVAYSSLGAEFGGVVPRIRHVKPGPNSTLSVGVDGADVTVSLATDVFGSIVSSASDVADAINSHIDASLIFRATALGTGAQTAGETVYRTVPGRLLTEDAGPFDWALLPRPEIDLTTKSYPRGYLEFETSDAEVTVGGINPSRIRSLRASFKETDVGKLATLRGSSLGNDGIYEIVAVLSATELELDATLVGPETGLYCALRAKTRYDDGTAVVIRPPSLLAHLARDFAEELDTQQSETRQRSMVADQKKWIGIKGHPECYRILGKMSGFDVDVTQLFRVPQDILEVLPNANIYPIGTTTPGKSGLKGRLEAGTAGRTQFRSIDVGPAPNPPSPDFSITDVGRSIVISNASVSGNNKSYVIEEIVNSSTVIFRIEDQAAALSEPNNNNLTWQTVRYYTDLQPEMPLFDEIAPEAFAEYVEQVNLFEPTKFFEIDHFCWEDNFYTTIHTTVASVTTVGINKHRVRVVRSGVTGSGYPIGDVVELILSLGVWRFDDSAGTSFFLDTVPVTVSATHAEFDVFALQAPVTGEASITYECGPVDFGCDWCASYVAQATCVPDTIVDEVGEPIEDVFDRLLTRISEATPAHVQLAIKYSQYLQASLTILASGFADGVFAAFGAIIGTGTVTASSALILVGSVSMSGVGFVGVGSALSLIGSSSLTGVGGIVIGSGVIFVDSASLTGVGVLTADATVV